MWRSKRKKLFQQIVEEHQASISRIAWGYANAMHSREDLEQEIAMALWKACASFRGDCALRTFVFRVAHNHCISKVIRRKQQQLQTSQATQDPNELQDQQPLADQQLIAKQTQVRLETAIQQLSLPYRQVLMLSLEQLSHAEIAEIVGISQGNVGVRLNRARDMLRAIMHTESRESP